LKIKQFFYAGDNLGYLLYSGRKALAIDGGAVDAILTFVKSSGLTLTKITNTHGHGDHTTGTRKLLKISGAAYMDHRDFTDGQIIDLGGEPITVRLTPGHTADSVSFVAGDFLVTGDTLFNGTIGNCFSGDLQAFYRSICLLMDYPDATRIYAGHDYVQESLAFARHLMPENRAIDDYARRYDAKHVVSTLAQEKAVNPYLRFNAPEIVKLIEAKKMPAKTEYQRWEGIMAIE
jgi:hydroxyacylglutathione hydrolase